MTDGKQPPPPLTEEEQTALWAKLRQRVDAIGLASVHIDGMAKTARTEMDTGNARWLEEVHQYLEGFYQRWAAALSLHLDKIMGFTPQAEAIFLGELTAKDIRDVVVAAEVLESRSVAVVVNELLDNGFGPILERALLDGELECNERPKEEFAERLRPLLERYAAQSEQEADRGRG